MIFPSVLLKRQRGGGSSSGSVSSGTGSAGSRGGTSGPPSIGGSPSFGGGAGSIGGSSGGRGTTGSSGGNTGGGSGGGGARGPPVSVGGSSTSTTSTGRGGGSPIQIPAGQPFAGRSQGGGTRDQVYGTSWYGSGYPGSSGIGVAGRGFPFYFWPITWGGAVGFGGAHYLNASGEYGSPENTTRPGGPEFTTTFISSNISTNSTFRLLADNTTTTSLIPTLISSCNSSLSSPSSIKPSQYPPTGPPIPEQAVQYYRASSVALTLDGYNNTAVFSGNESTPQVPLPGDVDRALLNCLNQTIGNNVPLVSAAVHVETRLMMESLGSFLLVWWLFRAICWI